MYVNVENFLKTLFMFQSKVIVKLNRTQEMIMHADDNIESFLSKRYLVFYLAEASPMLLFQA